LCPLVIGFFVLATYWNLPLPLPLLFYGIVVRKEFFLEREAKAFGLKRRKRIFWFLKPDPNMITLTFFIKEREFI